VSETRDFFLSIFKLRKYLPNWQPTKEVRSHRPRHLFAGPVTFSLALSDVAALSDDFKLPILKLLTSKSEGCAGKIKLCQPKSLRPEFMGGSTVFQSAARKKATER